MKELLEVPIIPPKKKTGELWSRCCRAKVTQQKIAVPMKGSYRLVKAYYCDKCKMVCEVVAKEEK